MPKPYLSKAWSTLSLIPKCNVIKTICKLNPILKLNLSETCSNEILVLKPILSKTMLRPNLIPKCNLSKSMP